MWESNQQINNSKSPNSLLNSNQHKKIPNSNQQIHNSKQPINYGKKNKKKNIILINKSPKEELSKLNKHNSKQINGLCTWNPFHLEQLWKYEYLEKGLAGVFVAHLKELNAPFHEAPDKIGWFLTTKVAAKSWLESWKSLGLVYG